MAFSDNQADAFSAWLEKFNPKCPICQNPKFNVHFNFFAHSSQPGFASGAQVTRDATTYLRMSCSNCGCVLEIDRATAKVPST
jgi:hypothetical protein